jgi:hypothetical protein
LYKCIFGCGRRGCSQGGPLDNFSLGCSQGGPLDNFLLGCSQGGPLDNMECDDTLTHYLGWSTTHRFHEIHLYKCIFGCGRRGCSQGGPLDNFSVGCSQAGPLDNFSVGCSQGGPLDNMECDDTLPHYLGWSTTHKKAHN